MFITDKEVQRVVSSQRNFQIARQYHYNDCVNEIYITFNEKTPMVSAIIIDLLKNYFYRRNKSLAESKSREGLS